ncbi:MAG TPA: J domain-containing protein, partial [Polyangiaceae bacterium]|nr:J domain-containing protein [Polyangiaceae bacterium]
MSPTPQVHISPPPRVPASPPPRSPPAPNGRLETLAPPSADRLGTPEIDETLSISVELQQRILDLSSRLGELDHFELLGIPRSADRAAVKRAYFSMIGTFHPDRYFSKRIGGFTKRMEKIFQRLTEAHDVLSDAQAREEYESYLAALGRTRGLDGSSPPDVSVEDLERLLMQAEEQAKQKAEPPPPNKPSAPPPANGSGSTAARRASASPAASAPARAVSARPSPGANAPGASTSSKSPAQP